MLMAIYRRYDPFAVSQFTVNSKDVLLQAALWPTKQPPPEAVSKHFPARRVFIVFVVGKPAKIQAGEFQRLQQLKRSFVAAAVTHMHTKVTKRRSQSALKQRRHKAHFSRALSDDGQSRKEGVGIGDRMTAVFVVSSGPISPW